MKKYLALVLFTAALCSCAVMSSSRKSTDEAQSKQAFEAMKSLVGKWQGSMIDGTGAKQPTAVSYELVSAGSAVMERLSPGTEHEMITMYHLDGDGLLMTHYCAMGNQPRLDLVGVSHQPETTLTFEYRDATNLASPKQMVMHGMRLTMIDKDHIATSWTAYVDGKPNHTGNFEFTRESALRFLDYMK